LIAPCKNGNGPLENYFFPDDLETQIDAFVANYNICAITRASTI
jgi:hypothetical protein